MIGPRMALLVHASGRSKSKYHRCVLEASRYWFDPYTTIRPPITIFKTGEQRKRHYAKDCNVSLLLSCYFVKKIKFTNLVYCLPRLDEVSEKISTLNFPRLQRPGPNAQYKAATKFNSESRWEPGPSFYHRFNRSVPSQPVNRCLLAEDANVSLLRATNNSMLWATSYVGSKRERPF